MSSSADQAPAAGDDPRAELARLGAGLRAGLQRRRTNGLRRVWVERPSEPARRPAAPARAQPTPRAEAPPRAPSPAAPQAPLREASPALTVARREAQGVRDLAGACADLASLERSVAACTACGLCRTRTQTVFADGSPAARVLFVGEAPGAEEDARGVPFVGRAGKLLTDIIEKGMGLRREQVYIANVLKCRPPDNRDPSPAEKLVCTPWLDRQIELIDPQVLIPLGRHASNHVLGTDLAMSRLRGRVHELGGRKVVPTFHPAYLLRSPGMKKECWADIQLAMGLLGLTAR